MQGLDVFMAGMHADDSRVIAVILVGVKGPADQLSCILIHDLCTHSVQTSHARRGRTKAASHSVLDIPWLLPVSTVLQPVATAFSARLRDCKHCGR